MRKLVCGVGINDADYRVRVQKELPKSSSGKRNRETVFMCPFYKVWENMINRCYNPRHLVKRPTYIDCTVCEEWKIFSNFKAWMETQNYIDRQLDKDLIVKGNKVY